MENEQPRFERINKYSVTIASLKNQLRIADNIDELNILAGKIIELEQQIIIERSAGYKKLEREKKEIEDKIDKIKRELRRAENDLDRVGNAIDFKINGYKKSLQVKIDSLSEEYNSLVGKLVEKSNE